MKEKLEKQDCRHEEPTPTISIKMACEVIVHAADEAVLSEAQFTQLVRNEIVNDFVTNVAQGQEIGLRKLDEIETEETIKSVVFEVQVLKKNETSALSSSSSPKCNRAEAVKVRLATLDTIKSATIVQIQCENDQDHQLLNSRKPIPRPLKYFLVLFVCLVIIAILGFLYFVWNHREVRSGVG